MRLCRTLLCALLLLALPASASQQQPQQQRTSEILIARAHPAVREAIAASPEARAALDTLVAKQPFSLQQLSLLLSKPFARRYIVRLLTDLEQLSSVPGVESVFGRLVKGRHQDIYGMGGAAFELRLGAWLKKTDRLVALSGSDAF